MNILHIIASANLADGGPIEGAVQMAEGFARRGHRQDLMTLDDPSAPFLQGAPGRVLALGLGADDAASPWLRLQRRLGLSPKAAPWLRSHISQYDVVIVSGLWNYSTVVARHSLSRARTPFVVFTHGMLDPWFKRRYPIKSTVKQLIWPFNEAVLLRRAARVLFTCEEERLLAASSFWPYRAKEHVVGFGAAEPPGDPELQSRLFARALPALQSRRYLLFLSRIHEKKGCDILIEAFAGVAREAPDLDLVIAGPDQRGLQSRLQERAAALGLATRIHWPGMITGDLKWGAFRGCEAFVLPSHQENFGVVLAEAMACGKPVLTTRKVNIWREIEADGAGVIGSDDVPGVLESLRRFIQMSPQARATMGLRARQCFVRRYQFDSFVDGLERLLLECCGERADIDDRARAVC